MKIPSENKVLGSFEIVSFPEFKIPDIVAKIDTGAYTGALHCTKIREKEIDGENVLCFSPFDHPEIEMKVTEFAIKYVRSSNGVKQNRYFIDTVIHIQGQDYPIALSLADRSEMKWPVLIGRRFLRQNHFLVDVRKTAQYREREKK